MGFPNMTGYSSGLKGTGLKQIISPTMNPQQQQIFGKLAEGVQPGLEKSLSHLSAIAGGDPHHFEAMEAPALRQFGALQGDIASRFSGVGSGARRSSGFQNTMSDAASSLAESLQSKRLSMQQEAINQLLGLSESLMGQRTFESSLIPKKQSAFLQLLASLGGGLSSGLGSAIGSRNFFGLGGRGV